MGNCRTDPIDLEAKFTPNMLNTTVYIISMALQVCTFAVNYRVRFLVYLSKIVVTKDNKERSI